MSLKDSTYLYYLYPELEPTLSKNCSECTIHDEQYEGAGNLKLVIVSTQLLFKNQNRFSLFVQLGTTLWAKIGSKNGRISDPLRTVKV